ncbi:amino acid synthesis family protein [Rhodococcus sp. NPDC057529]|uniref:amino acid synthesis family protein n=1 Tax=Rhodococcus sp. NPDC057529 TaxID=3346158 RepID=UPI00366F52F6
MTTTARLRHTDPSSIEARWGVRKIVVQAEEILSEHGAPVAGATRVTAAAVVRNPWIGNPVDSDLVTPVREIAPRLAKLLTDRVLDRIGGPDRVEAFGKGAIIGVAGELEHGAALIHTPYYANLVREFLAGDTVIAFADDRGDAGTALTVPLGRKDAGPTRNHFQTVVARIPDAPAADEIVIVAAASSGTRPFPRSGDRTTDQPVVSADLEGVFL